MWCDASSKGSQGSQQNLALSKEPKLRGMEGTQHRYEATAASGTDTRVLHTCEAFLAQLRTRGHHPAGYHCGSLSNV